MPWEIDRTSRPGVLLLRFEGRVSAEDVREFVAAHNAAVDAYRDEDYRVFCDLRCLVPLGPDAAEIMEEAKRYSATRPNFRGSAVLVDKAVVALQHRRTSISGGVIETELICADPDACEEHLRTVWRTA